MRTAYPQPVADPRFHVVLHEPEIPNNTGAIGRTCVATGCALHLIRPLAFDTDVKALRRAGLDYWPRLAPSEHESWDAYLEATGVREDRLWLYTTKTERPHWEATFRMGDHLVFGKETAGLPDSILDRYADRLVTLPMVPTERSLNLANAACAAVYEGLRQLACR
ncbi:MAG: tRNA (cytidine(34)-2'-O)-methyltransferase [Phycisphaeraceae bacterium]|nr:tRNA (cytidine(34)-2'-O)-methyltransferase [Phycisphaeraceae bacterium]